MFLDVDGTQGIELPLFTRSIISGFQTSRPGFKYDDVLLSKMWVQRNTIYLQCVRGLPRGKPFHSTGPFSSWIRKALCPGFQINAFATPTKDKSQVQWAVARTTGKWCHTSAIVVRMLKTKQQLVLGSGLLESYFHNSSQIDVRENPGILWPFPQLSVQNWKNSTLHLWSFFSYMCICINIFVHPDYLLGSWMRLKRFSVHNKKVSCLSWSNTLKFRVFLDSLDLFVGIKHGLTLVWHLTLEKQNCSSCLKC